VSPKVPNEARGSETSPKLLSPKLLLDIQMKLRTIIEIVKKPIRKFKALIGNIRHALIEKRIKKYKKLLTKYNSEKTSRSESGYVGICRLATEYDNIFKIFKRSENYRKMLEHVTKAQGKEYLDIISSEGKDLIKYIHKFKKNDKFGSPIRFRYNKVGWFSPTTLRYIKVLVDLRNIFGNLSNLDIVEIGAGYGGQCKIISDVFNIKSYTIVDLEMVLPLIQKYLSKHKVERIAYKTQQQLNSNEKYDLVISNYAFSECIKKVQDDYMQKILSRSKRGYITCNYDEPSSPNNYLYNKKELTQMLSKAHNIKIMDERPKTSPMNFIIVWDDTKQRRK